MNRQDFKPRLDDGYPLKCVNAGYSMSIEAVEAHGITWDEYHALLNAQGCCCAICEAHGPLVIDHDHETGKVRGLLCHDCNVGLGFFRDDAFSVSSAVSYLFEHELAA